MWVGYGSDISSLDVWGSVDCTYLDIQDATVTVGTQSPA